MKKYIKISLGILGVVFVILLVVPMLFKGKVEQIAKNEINKQLNANVDWGNLSLSVLRNFPNLTVGLQELSVIGVEKFDGDTLMYFSDFTVSVDLLSALSGKKIKVKGITLINPALNAKVMSDSTVNWDIAKYSEPTSEIEIDTIASESQDFQINLENFVVENATITYVDETMDLKTGIKGLNLNLWGDMSASLTDLNVSAFINEADITMGGNRYVQNLQTKLNATIQANLDDMEFIFKENDLWLNKLNLGFDGSIVLLDKGYELDLKLLAKRTDFKSLLELFPEEFHSEMRGLNAEGMLSLVAKAKGVYVDTEQLPSFNLLMNVKDAKIQYVDLPKSINNINVNLQIDNEGGSIDNTVVTLDTFHFEVDKNSFDAYALLKTPLSNAQFKADLVGMLNFASIKDALPLAEVEINGAINADIHVDGDMKMVEKEQYESLVINGFVDMQNFAYSSKDFPLPVKIRSAQVLFSPKTITLSHLNSQIGRSDYALQGKIENYISYAFNDEKIYGKLNLQSNLIDVNEFMIKEEVTNATQIEDTASVEVFEVPKNIDFTFTSSLKEILYDKLEINNTKGKITVQNGNVILDGVAMSLLDGEVVMAGQYNTQKEENPFVDFLFNAENININKAANSFTVVDTLMPIAKKAKGFISANVKYNSTLAEDMTPVISSITGGGKVKSEVIEISNSKVLNRMADLLKKDQYRKLKAEDIDIDFVMKDGKVIVYPFTARVFGKSLTISGEQGFDQSLNYVIKTPVSKKEIENAMSIVGSNLTDTEGDVLVDVIIKGKAQNPKISMDLTEVKKEMEKEVKKEVQEKAEKVIKEVIKDEKVKKTVDDIRKKLGF
jgi:hypothetical protein